jgi:regulator of sirC expression with transglutaminase-like and TPR domain
MDHDEAEGILSQAGAATDGEFPLLEAAIACAIHEEPARDAQVARDMGAMGVERLSLRLKRESPEEALAETMAGELGLGGDR